MAEASGRFREIYEAYSGLIYTYALRRTGDAETANDIVGETFLVAWRRMTDVPAGDEARPWLYAVARRVLSTHHRSDRRRARLTARLQLALPRHLEVATGNEGQDLELIRRAFNNLSASDQELLTLVGWDGLSAQDLATTLNATAATVRVRLHRARRRFEHELGAVGLQRHAVAGHEGDRWAPARPDLEEA